MSEVEEITEIKADGAKPKKLKTEKAKIKTQFTRARHVLRQLLQGKGVEYSVINEAWAKVDVAQQNAQDIVTELTEELFKISDDDNAEKTNAKYCHVCPPCLWITSEGSIIVKISRQKGEAGHEDKPSFSSLVHQLDDASEREIPEQETIGGVIRSIQPGLSLRGYLESRRGLTMAALRKVLRSHFRKGNATDLYQQLSNGTQDTEEVHHTFYTVCLFQCYDQDETVIVRVTAMMK
ncbi:hypothetical protein HOLleu_01059 [Holothuria leucospilota]|uniref:Uncharacterized protein n=1 Tax=Holothuria leucospilota TaxID=206669 RepID=A0A9Q1HKQ3_HOLLE|nr:hypothetical protein HOLleu_01059 [Holothuria leucospilota]